LPSHWQAAWAGYRDGRAGLPAIALDLDAHGRLQPPDPGFGDRVRQLVRARQECRYADFVDRTARLRRELHGKALRVAGELDAGLPPRDSIELQRFTAALAHWASLVQAEQPRITAVTLRGRAVMSVYWNAVKSTHPIFRDAAYSESIVRSIAQRNHARYPHAMNAQFPFPSPDWKPAPVPDDERWQSPLDLLILPDAPAATTGPLRRALQILADLGNARPNQPRPAEAS
jgi:hypothetical protein